MESSYSGAVASAVAGGKFANGALTGAFGYLYSEKGWFVRKMLRQPGNIYITGHRVGKVGPYHTALEYVDSAGNSEWLSAGPEGYSREGFVSLVSSPNRSSDDPRWNNLFGRVIPPSGSSSDRYFRELKSEDEFYCDCADYDLFPDAANGYNSNSYINSLIKRTGGSSTVDMGNFIGGSKNIPEGNKNIPDLYY